MYSRAVSPSVSARVSPVRRVRKRNGERVRGVGGGGGREARRKERKDEGEFVRVSETRRVFIRRDGEWRRG